MGEDVEGGAGGEPTGESTPKYEEMTPEQQEVHDTATKREAEDVSEDVKKYQETLDFAQEKGLNVEAIKENLINASHEKALEENIIVTNARISAEMVLTALAAAQVKEEEITIPFDYDDISESGRESYRRMHEILESKPSDANYVGSAGNAELVQMYDSRMGRFLIYDSQNQQGVKSTFVRALPSETKQ